jgi:hypothetical protein
MEGTTNTASNVFRTQKVVQVAKLTKSHLKLSEKTATRNRNQRNPNKTILQERYNRYGFQYFQDTKSGLFFESTFCTALPRACIDCHLNVFLVPLMANLHPG